MNIAFIPARGGSKSIPLKNIKPMCEQPLIYWTIKAASECKYIDKVYISTDSKEIRETIDRFSFHNIEVVDRSPESATDYASTESAMLEFAEQHHFNYIILIQATSPLTKPEDLNKGFEALADKNIDSVISVVRQTRFIWSENQEGLATPINYDVYNRPRRQEFKGYFVENGAFYITSRELLLKSKNRISGNIKMVELVAETYFEIDEPSDWNVVESLMKKKVKHDKRGFPDIKMFLTDCDGCLTDGGMYYSEHGDELKKFNAKDGMGFQLLREKGILTGVITGEDVKLNHRRVSKLKSDIYVNGAKNKLQEVMKLCHQYSISMENIAYVGDDINDLELIKKVGFGCAVADAVSEVKEAAVYTSVQKGGMGAVREIIDYILSK